MHFSPEDQAGGGDLYVTLGASGHLSTAMPVPCHLHSSIRSLLPHQPEGLGGCGDVLQWHYLPPGLYWGGVAGDRTYGLSMVWVNPYQARVPTVEEAVKQLTTLVSSGPDWPYTLMWLNGDTHHSPFPRKGHLSVLPKGGTSSAACRRVSQLEVCLLLSWDLQVICRAKWAPHPFDNLSAWVPGQWHKPN